MQRALIFLLVAIPILASAQATLPDLGDPTSVALSPYTEQRIGRGVYQELQRLGAVNTDVLATDYLQALGDKLVGTQQEGPYHYVFFIVNEGTINAFALPGGFIGVNMGLILSTDTEDELAAVMAHEIAHVKQRHIARFYRYQSQTNIASIVGLLTAAVLMPQNSALGQGVLAATMAGQNQTLINFTRYQEQEADQIGMRLLTDAEFNPHAMPAFFQTLEQYARINGHGDTEYLQTHPLTENRIAQAQQRADQYAATMTQMAPPNAWYSLMKARLALANNTNLQTALPSLEKRCSAAAPALADQYGYALALLANGNPKKALETVDNVVPPPGVQPLFTLIHAQAALMMGHESQALAILKNLYNAHPEYHAMGRLYAAVLLPHHPRQASFILEHLRADYPEDAEIHRLRSEAYAALQRPLDAYLARADYHFYRGELSEARLSLRLAKKLVSPDSIDLARIKEKEADFYL